MNKDDPDFPHEEFNMLLGMSAPGTVRRFCSGDGNNNNSSGYAAVIDRHRIQGNGANFSSENNNAVNLIMADVMCDARPSGVILPKILRKKLRLQEQLQQQQLKLKEQQQQQQKNMEIDGAAGVNAQIQLHLQLEQQQQQQQQQLLDQYQYKSLPERVAIYNVKRRQKASQTISSTTFSSSQTSSNERNGIVNDKDDDEDSESDMTQLNFPKNYTSHHHHIAHISPDQIHSTTSLEKRLSQAKGTLVEIQRQLHCGEEKYFQDTDGHGNLYKGWDTFIDVKLEDCGAGDLMTFLAHNGILSGAGASGASNLSNASMLGGNNNGMASSNYNLGVGSNIGGRNGGIGSNGMHVPMVPIRRMPADHRWFSTSSCTLFLSESSSGVTSSGGSRGERKRQSTGRRGSSSGSVGSTPTLPVPSPGTGPVTSPASQKVKSSTSANASPVPFNRVAAAEMKKTNPVSSASPASPSPVVGSNDTRSGTNTTTSTDQKTIKVQQTSDSTSPSATIENQVCTNSSTLNKTVSETKHKSDGHSLSSTTNSNVNNINENNKIRIDSTGSMATSAVVTNSLTAPSPKKNTGSGTKSNMPTNLNSTKLPSGRGEDKKSTQELPTNIEPATATTAVISESTSNAQLRNSAASTSNDDKKFDTLKKNNESMSTGNKNNAEESKQQHLKDIAVGPTCAHNTSNSSATGKSVTKNIISDTEDKKGGESTSGVTDLDKIKEMKTRDLSSKSNSPALPLDTNNISHGGISSTTTSNCSSESIDDKSKDRKSSNLLPKSEQTNNTKYSGNGSGGLNFSKSSNTALTSKVSTLPPTSSSSIQKTTSPIPKPIDLTTQSIPRKKNDLTMQQTIPRKKKQPDRSNGASPSLLNRSASTSPIIGLSSHSPTIQQQQQHHHHLQQHSGTGKGQQKKERSKKEDKGRSSSSRKKGSRKRKSAGD